MVRFPRGRRGWGVEGRTMLSLYFVSSYMQIVIFNVIIIISIIYIRLYICTCRSLSGLHVTIISTLPFGAGLGSSAAYSVCLSAAFLQAMTATCKSSTNTHATCTTHADISTPLKQPLPSQALSTNTTERPPPDTVSGSGESALDCGSIPEEIQRKLEKEADVKLRGLGVSAWSQRELLDSANEWGFKAEKIIHGTPSGIDNSISTFGMLVLIFVGCTMIVL